MAGVGNTCFRIHLLSRRLWSKGGFRRKLAKLVQWGNQVLLGCFIGCEAQIDETCTFMHNGLGVVIHDRATIGPRCTIFQHVTIGCSYRGGVCDGLAPRIGSDVLIGVGACILGDIAIGDGARIGANAVVLHDVPAGATAVGVPAKIRPASAKVAADDHH